MSNNSFVLRDKDIYGVYKTLDHALTTILQYIYVCSQQKLKFDYSQLKIYEYDNNCIQHIYKLLSDFKLVDENGSYYISNNISVKDFMLKLTGKKNVSIDSDTNLQMFVSYNDDSDSDTHSSCREERELKLKLKILNDLKNKEDVALAKMQEEERMTELTNKTFIDIQEERYKAKEEERRSKFLIDLNVYQRLKSEMNDGIRGKDDVPPIFSKEYDAYKKLDDANMIGRSDEEMYQFFINNIEKQSAYSGSYNTIFDENPLDILRKYNSNLDEISNTCSSESSDSDESDDYDDKIYEIEDETCKNRLIQLQDEWFKSITPDYYISFKKWLYENDYDIETGCKCDEKHKSESDSNSEK